MEIVPTTTTSSKDDSAGSSDSTSHNVVDVSKGSLPYIDYLDENYEAYALSLIEEEMQKISPNDNIDQLKHLPNPLPNLWNNTQQNKSSTLLQKEYKDLVDREGNPRPPISTTTIATAPVKSLQKDEHAWKIAIRKAKINLESERSKLCNLEIQQIFESQNWKKHLITLQTNANDIGEQLNKQKLQVDIINAKRKDRQEKEAAPRLYSLSTRYEELIQNIQNYANATKQLNHEIKRMKTENSNKNQTSKEDKA